MSEDFERFKGKISKEDFECRVAEKIKEFQGLLTKEGAISIIASELGVEQAQPADISIKVSDIVEGMTNIDIVGRVTRISSVKEFIRKTTGDTGKVLSFVLADETDSIRVVLWDDIADSARMFSVGDVVRVTGGFAKKGFNDYLEISLSRRGKVRASTAEVDIPVVNFERVDIGDLSEAMANIMLVGVVAGISDVKEHERNGRTFKVCSMYLKDNTGQTRISLWNNHAELTRNFSIGDIIQLKGCYTKAGFNGIEVQTNSYTEIETNPVIEGLALPTIDHELQLADITSDHQFFTVRGTIKQVFEKRTFARDDGTQSSVGTMEIQDESGTCKVALWEDKADLVTLLAPGTCITIEGCKAREGLDGVEISVGRSGRVVPHLPDTLDVGLMPEGLARIIEIKDGTIKAISKESQFLIKTESQDFKAGDLIIYKGRLEGDIVVADSVHAASDDYPTIDDLLSPPYKFIKDIQCDEVVRLQGIVRSVAKIKDHTLLHLDDGSGNITGYIKDNGVAAGSEYFFVARIFNNGFGPEFVSHTSGPVDMEKEAYQLLELIGEEGKDE